MWQERKTNWYVKWLEKCEECEYEVGFVTHFWWHLATQKWVKFLLKITSSWWRSAITLFLCVVQTLCWHWHFVAGALPSDPVSKPSSCCSGCWEIFVLSKVRGVHLCIIEDVSASCTHFLFLAASFVRWYGHCFLLLSVVLKHPCSAHLGFCRFSMLVQMSRLCLYLCMPSPFSTAEYVVHSQSHK